MADPVGGGWSGLMAETGLVSRSYCLGGFVPVQGEGTFTETLVPIDGEATLRVDTPEPGST
ncbi:hypothetical protein AB0L34_03815 [Micromonospora sp. NPDC052213]|uniref:hypothetical protein n=1 Tax=Micromonospora sp. NPDC052213 TaxID=3155812 RepID=UPI00341C2017